MNKLYNIALFLISFLIVATLHTQPPLKRRKPNESPTNPHDATETKVDAAQYATTQLYNIFDEQFPENEKAIRCCHKIFDDFSNADKQTQIKSIIGYLEADKPTQLKSDPLMNIIGRYFFFYRTHHQCPALIKQSEELQKFAITAHQTPIPLSKREINRPPPLPIEKLKMKYSS